MKTVANDNTIYDLEQRVLGVLHTDDIHLGRGRACCLCPRISP